jgi:hypothetical protein
MSRSRRSKQKNVRISSRPYLLKGMRYDQTESGDPSLIRKLLPKSEREVLSVWFIYSADSPSKKVRRVTRQELHFWQEDL